MISMTSHAASSSSSVSNSSFTYQVFLSFRGEDTRYNFTDTLYHILCEKGINTFMDDKLPKGEKISAELVKAIKESEVSIIVFSENYASSRWCLDELVEILQCKTSNQQEVRAIFYKIDPSDVRHQKGTFGDAFKQFEQVGKYKDSMAKWRKALTDAADINGWPFSDGRSEFLFISKIVKELSANVLIPSNNLEVAKFPIGIDSRRQHVENLLDIENESDQMRVGIWGPGGVGKSTIAKAVFNSIKHNFEGSCFLADVRSNSIPHGGLAKLQETLLSDILRDSNLRVDNVDKGVGFIKTRMRRKRVFLVLDDVSELEQIDYLAPCIDCFGPGSRILITTRDQQWLATHTVKPTLVYKIEMMNDVQASELFSQHAFECNRPPNDFVELTQRAVHYARGLPLALVVLGSHLFPRSKEEWEAILDSYRGDHLSKIGEVLRISYDALGDDLKEFFLDIACFFKGKNIAQVQPVLEACHEDLKPVIGFKQLQEKSLIRIVRVQGSNLIWMHDLIEEMGKDIGKSSRLWNWDDFDRALTDNTGTERLKGIQIPHPPFGRQWTMLLNAKSFSEMKNLKYFSVDSRITQPSNLNIDYLPNELRWFYWFGCPLLSIPTNFSPRKLIRLSISDSCITRLWEGQKIHLPFLKYFELVKCKSLKELPDFNGMRNLETLILSGCSSLVEMHHSMGALHKLVTLRVTGKAHKNWKLTAFPKFNGEMICLRELTLKWNDIKELDLSIGNLIGLEELTIEGLKNITMLPSSILVELKKLEKLKVSICWKFVRFPIINRKMDSLRELKISYSGILEVDGSIRNLTGLQDLSFDHCMRLTTLPCSIYELQNLRSLDLDYCITLTAFPTNFKNLLDDNGGGTLSLPRLERLNIRGCNLSECNFLKTLDCLDTLTYLDLSTNNIVSLPECISKFLNLEELNLIGCDKLREVPELPPNLVSVDTSDCCSLERFWNLSEVLEGQKIKWISLWNCCNLGFNIVSLEGLLLNIQANSQFCVVFPGTITAEDANWLDCWKDLEFTISKDLKWENLGFVFIAESVEDMSFKCATEIFINGVSISYDDDSWDSHNMCNHLGSSDHVWVRYIPLTVEMKAKVDDQKVNSTLPHYEYEVVFYSRVHEFSYYLVCKESKDDENSSHKVAEEPIQQKRLLGENNASDFPELTNPRQQKRQL